ncbi:MAG: hypothetical protein ACRBN8_46355 [Nannocystales bacterium]
MKDVAKLIETGFGVTPLAALVFLGVLGIFWHLVKKTIERTTAEDLAKVKTTLDEGMKTRLAAVKTDLDEGAKTRLLSHEMSLRKDAEAYLKTVGDQVDAIRNETDDLRRHSLSLEAERTKAFEARRLETVETLYSQASVFLSDAGMYHAAGVVAADTAIKVQAGEAFREATTAMQGAAFAAMLYVSEDAGLLIHRFVSVAASVDAEGGGEDPLVRAYACLGELIVLLRKEILPRR